MFSVAEENYIKSIYHLQRSGYNVSTNELASHLQTKPASVTDMLKKLQAKNLLHYEKYYGFKLAPDGRKLALSIIRRHRLWEYFLVEKLGFGWEEVHDIAEQLEHVQSAELTDKLDVFLGHPRFDPHGDPIPDQKGKMESQKLICLLDAPLGKQLIVAAVQNQSVELLEMLKAKRLAIGTKLIIKKRFAFDESMEVKLSGNDVFSLSDKLGREVLVTLNQAS